MAMQKGDGPPGIGRPEEDLEGYTPRVVVKFDDEIRQRLSVPFPYVDDIADFIDRYIGPWKEFLGKFPEGSIRRFFNAVGPERITELVSEAVKPPPDWIPPDQSAQVKAGKPPSRAKRKRKYVPPDFLTYFVIDCPAKVDPEAVVKVLSEWKNVELAYIDPPGYESTPYVSQPELNPYYGQQQHLRPGPTGIGAESVWGVLGGDGAGQKLIDLERGWTLDHEDLVDKLGGKDPIVGTMRNDSKHHGTAVMGVVCATNNGKGCIGIVPNLGSVDIASHWGTGNSVANAILAAIDVLAPGDVLLLEVQKNYGGKQNMPVEGLLANFYKIELASQAGIVVIEAAGNGANDLDQFKYYGKHVFDKRVRDSGAIMVGAADSSVPHIRSGSSNFGSRIDCYAWGEDVCTCDSDAFGSTNGVTPCFGGTSAAAAIIAGVALAVQGMAEKNLGRRFTSLELRGILSDPANGTPVKDSTGKKVGSMPNLKKIYNRKIKNS